ncbi:terminase gpP N-terminus-related DNA-binding protein [Lacrimispora algidixylanolytica]|uniref:terminase gpP N-terminus-related DNA-binding protein n=1 Tax=Lacrimispora algidixylanolytica TaxID=94868 RepID=UPI000E75BF3F|nr:helix-turn-helix domain-containing protein [Lacrimispora algidixylanolytica]
MEQAAVEQLVKTAALEAVQLFEKSQKKSNKTKAHHNAKKLIENYNRIRESIRGDVSEITGMNHNGLEESLEEDIYLNSVLRNKLRSSVTIAHIDKCLRLLEEEQSRKNAPEKYKAFKLFYLDGVTQEEIAEMLCSTDRTVRRWVSEVTDILSVYLFGTDAIILD